MKPLLTVDQLIDHMKTRGIKFDIMSEAETKKFLQENNYYMKLASYRANYLKYETGSKAGQYINLDAAYLKELSTIDMHLRYLIIQMCLDIEHALKVTLLTHVEKNEKEDGYELIRRFIGEPQNEHILKKIRGHKSSGYSKALIEKYYPYFPVWVFVELISFGDLTHLIKFYSDIYSEPIVNNKFMNNIRDMRNASAHSNCLINKLFEPLGGNKQIDSTIANYVKAVNGISDKARSKYLNYRVVYDFVTLLYVYDIVVPNGIAKTRRHHEIKELVNDRMTRHKEYFASNNRITGVHGFIKKIVDSLSV